MNWNILLPNTIELESTAEMILIQFRHRNKEAGSMEPASLVFIPSGKYFFCTYNKAATRLA